MPGKRKTKATTITSGKVLRAPATEITTLAKMRGPAAIDTTSPSLTFFEDRTKEQLDAAFKLIDEGVVSLKFPSGKNLTFPSKKEVAGRHFDAVLRSAPPAPRAASKFKAPKLKRVCSPNMTQWEVGTTRQNDGYYRLTHIQNCSGLIQVWVHPDKSATNDTSWLTRPYCAGCGRWAGKHLCARILRRYDPLKQPTAEGEAASICFIDSGKASDDAERRARSSRETAADTTFSPEDRPDFSPMGYDDIKEPSGWDVDGKISKDIFRRGKFIIIATSTNQGILLVALHRSCWTHKQAIDFRHTLLGTDMLGARLAAMSMCDRAGAPRGTIIVSTPVVGRKMPTSTPEPVDPEDSEQPVQQVYVVNDTPRNVTIHYMLSEGEERFIALDRNRCATGEVGSLIRELQARPRASKFSFLNRVKSTLEYLGFEHLIDYFHCSVSSKTAKSITWPRDDDVFFNLRETNSKWMLLGYSKWVIVLNKKYWPNNKVIQLHNGLRNRDLPPLGNGLVQFLRERSRELGILDRWQSLLLVRTLSEAENIEFIEGN